MKKQLIIYAVLIAVFIVYNFFFKIEDDRINTAIYIVITSLIFGYISYLAYIFLKNLNKKR